MGNKPAFMEIDGSLTGLLFQSSEQELSLGVELELQVLDGQNLLLCPRASEIIDLAQSPNIKQEFFQSTLEIATGVCRHVQDVEHEAKKFLQLLKSKTETLGLKLSSTGTHPVADYRDRLITNSSRYEELIDRNQWLIRRMAVYGMHIHLGMPSGEHCIRYNYFFMHFLPHILALSASSPFWQSMDTGLSACRLTTYEALPTAGMPYMVRTWGDFQKLYNFLIRANAIQSMKDLWWDLRPSPFNGTLELRFPDEPATLKEALAITAFVHLLAYWFRDHAEEWTKGHSQLKYWIFRENKWRAIRYGLNAEIVSSRNGKTKPLRKQIQNWLKVLRPYAIARNYQDYLTTLEEVLERGTSADRQTGVYHRTRDLMAVVQHNVNEFYRGEPVWN
jgi:carboxylate-amine ligase